MADTQQLSLALTSQSNRDNSPDITDTVTNEIKTSVIFQYNWQDLLQSAPVAVSSTGACYAAGFSDAGLKVQLEPPVSGNWKYLNDKSLAANLVACGDRGRIAFMTAETGLFFVKDVSRRAENKVSDVIDCIGDPASAKKLLKPFLGQLKSMADDCYNKVVNINDKFDDWLMFTCELHATCVGTESSDSEKLQTTEINLAVEQSRFDSQKASVTDAKAINDSLKKQLDTTTEAFKKASDNFPSGWDILGQQIVGSLADCATTALSGLVTAYTSNMNPVAKASTGVSMFDGLMKDTTNTAKGTPSGNTQAAPTPPPTYKTPAPPFAQDPAYSMVQKDLPFLGLVDALLNKGPNNSINWDDASGTGSATGSAAYAASILKDAQAAFTSMASKDQPSVDLMDILSTAVEVSSSLQTEAEKGLKANNAFPAADSDIVKGWQSKFKTAYIKAQSMVTIARTLPGTSPQGLPIMANGTDPSVQIAQTNAKSAQAQATLEAAKNRLSTTQDACMKTQELYAKNASLLLEQENKLTEIQAALTQLNQTKVGLTEIKQILQSCIKLIVAVKQNITDLCTFFKAMSLTIEAIVNYSVKGFLDTVAASVSADGNSDVNAIKIGDYTLVDFERTKLFQGAVSIRAQFSVFGDIAAMWGDLSRDFVMPGVEMLDNISDTSLSPADRQKVVSKLQQWSSSAVQGVKDVSATSQKKILDSLSSRVDDIQSTTKQIPPSPPMQKAITEGVNTTNQAAITAITANAAAKPLNRFGGTRVS